MKIIRRFTKAGGDVFASVKWEKRVGRIAHADGSVIFEMKDAEIPAEWSQLAIDIVTSKYFRKAGVPQVDELGKVVLGEDGKPVLGPEKSVRQVVHRLAGCWAHWGKQHGYFDTDEDVEAFYDELAYMLLHQMAAPNSPQWFNTGLNFAYGLTGPSQGHWHVNPRTGQLEATTDAYTHPQPHACFIQSVNDDLVNEGGIMDLWTREARLFKYGSGTGTNFSKVRGENENLSGGGKSSGLMSFLKIGDRAAGAIKSGGTTRRAAKMVSLDLDHPDIEEFINWKVREEIKVACLIEGIKHLPKEQREVAQRMKLKLDYDFNGEAYHTVSGQNSNNSVRVPNKFLQAVEKDGDWDTIKRTTGKVYRTLKARELWKQIGYAAWRCADPGVQFDDTINEWHTCPQSGRINASNPCSEYMFLDDTACNLASINLMKLFNEKTREFDLEGFKHACKLWTMVLEISVLMAAYPSREIARLSYEYRTLGLGYTNIGTMLMVAGIPYDSDRGRAVCGAITAIMTGESYATSAELAKEHGPFAGYHKNRNDMLRVMRNHRAAAYGGGESGRRGEGEYEGLTVRPMGIDAGMFGVVRGAVSDFGAGLRDQRQSFPNTAGMLHCARECWDRALAMGEQYGYRNAQVTVIAPTGTIGLLMDCDTTGFEPDFALVKDKKLAGGGRFRIVNQSIEPALHNLGYSDKQVKEILTYVLGARTLKGVPNINQDVLKAKGFTEEELAQTEACLPSAFELAFAFSPWSLGESCMQRLGFAREVWQASGFNLLKALGFSKKQIREANEFVCGAQTIEGAPHLKPEHYAVFDCANRCGRKGKRFIHYMGHVKMMAAAQPFISGAISKTINMPNEVSVADIEEAYMESWKLSLKAVALYRDGSKLSQPLNSSSDDDAADDQEIDALKAEVQAVCQVCGDPAPSVSHECKNDAGKAGKVSGEVGGGGGQLSEPVEKVVVKIVERPLRRRLADTRASVTHKFDIAGHEGYITVGLFEDNTPGEVFITMAKQGSTIGGLMDTIATLISLNLQYGVPVDAMVRKFEHMRFEPAGMTMNRDIPFAKSFIDYIVRWMGMQFIPGYRAANVPKRESQMNSIEPSRPVGLEKDQGGSEPAFDAGLGRPVVREAAAGQGGPSSSNGNGYSYGNGNGEQAASLVDTSERLQTVLDPLSVSLGKMMGDAPTCTCGSITVRNGSCYKCLNCGASLGCS
ncbi:MAG: adenosylcobalamin-dependent ribonucleoside-diphosphate reductase [Phycisphaerales bacterium]|nr:adenosylcobalamin-dependent ribonucleoside-diphosphate reductase [Phycisphaerales bacterium]